MPDPIPPLLSSLKIRPGLWIDGKWREDAHERIAVRDPSNGSVVAQVPLAGPAEFKAAIDGAHEAFESWRSEPAASRGNILKKAAALMAAGRERLAEVLTREQGKPLAQALAEVDYAASFFQWFGE
jgi:succinate-semialdehyde dehydrogenase/glutarate-semialdehyde dehydrogenase